MKFNDLTKKISAAKESKIKFIFGDDFELVINGETIESLKGQSFDLVSTMSKEYKKHVIDIQRKYVAIEDRDPDEYERDLVAGLVVGWSFEDELTHENKVRVLEDFGKSVQLEIVNKSNNINFIRSSQTS